MNTKQNFSTLELTKMALLTALICVSAYIVIPLPFSPASLTAQTLVVNLIALLLTPRQAAFTIVVYMLLGLSGQDLGDHQKHTLPYAWVASAIMVAVGCVACGLLF
mgnify:CR=1 FL=1